MLILVVDDSPTMINIVRDVLRNLGYENVDTANGGNSALEKMKTKSYGLIISEWIMEPMSGLALLRCVRTRSAKTPFIAMSMEAHVENVIAAKKAGGNGFIVKPFGAQTMKAKIKSLFAETAVS